VSPADSRQAVRRKCCPVAGASGETGRTCAVMDVYFVEFIDELATSRNYIISLLSARTKTNRLIFDRLNPVDWISVLRFSCIA
jgi:hypothetical protein